MHKIDQSKSYLLILLGLSGSFMKKKNKPFYLENVSDLIGKFLYDNVNVIILFKNYNIFKIYKKNYPSKYLFTFVLKYYYNNNFFLKFVKPKFKLTTWRLNKIK